MRKHISFLAVFGLLANWVIAQNVGIGTANPRARLHVADSSVLFTASATLPANAGNTPVSGPGYRMMWFANKAALRFGRTTGNQSDAAQIGLLSFAAGQDNIVTGFASGAIGTENIVRGSYNFAAGYGNQSRSVTAAAFGFNNIVKPQHGFVLGLHNDTTDIAFGDIANGGDRLFQIGNGSTSNNRSNALTVLRNGNTGIGTVNPAARLHVADSNVVFSNALPATINYSEPLVANPSAPPLGGIGNLTYWYADKAAFRTGGAYLNSWNKENTGDYSFAANIGNRAVGFGSAAFGEQNRAIGRESFVAGFGNIVNAIYGAAFGSINNVRGVSGFAAGNRLVQKNTYSIVVGSLNDDNEPEQPIENFPAGTSRLFQVGNGGWVDGFTRSNALTILWNGNIGLGNVNSPNAPLHFNNALQNRKIILHESTNNNHQYYGFGVNSGVLRYQTDAPSADHVFYSAASASISNELLRIKGNGNVGIRNDNANAPLQFANDTRNRKLVLFEAANNDHQFYGLGVNSGTFRYQVPVPADAHVFFAGTSSGSSQELMRIAGSGNVGIGVSNPQVPLHFATVLGKKISLYRGPLGDAGFGVWGNELRIHSDYNGADITFGFDDFNNGFTERFRVRANGNATLAGVLTQNSDARLKKDILPLSNTLEAIRHLNGYSYHWKDASNPDEQIGLLAQEIQKVYPQLVKENEQGTLSVNYSGMVPVLLEALKEQQAQIEELKNLILMMQKNSK